MTYIFLTLKRRHNPMLNELKKFTSKLYIKILILVVILASVVIANLGSKGFSAITSATGNIVKGKAAISLMKEQYKNSKGALTIDKLNKALKYYNSIPDTGLQSVETDIKYLGIFDLMEKAYVYDDAKESAIFHKLKNMHDFYSRN